MAKRLPAPDAFNRTFPDIIEVSTLEPRITDRDDCRYYTMGDLQIVYYLPTDAEPSYNLGISHPTRYPSWDEIVWIRYQIAPADLTMALILPPLDQYINVVDATGHSRNTFMMQSVEQVDNRIIAISGDNYDRPE